MNIKTIWEKSIEMVKNMTDDSIGYKVYIESAVPISDDGKLFTISVPITISKNMIELRYSDFIEAALERVTGRVLTLKVIVSDITETPDPEAEFTIFPERTEPVNPTMIGANSVNPNYTFENFVTGSSNATTTAFAISASEKPGYIYNPLFIHGNSGLGKTHLMHAIGNKIKSLCPNFNVMYVTSETFTNEFIDALKNQTTMDFKKKYRTVDVLLIDDIQFIEKKESTQEEFFHTFNALYNLNKQIVITSDRKPSDLVTLEERLRTRFSQGMTTDLSVPDLETRVAILKKKAELHRKNIPEDVLLHIAERIRSNVRELEGALLKIISMSQLSGNVISVEYADTIIDSILPDGGDVRLTPDKIMDKVSSFYSITKEDLTGKSKLKNFAFPRQVAMYLCHKLTDMNYGMIGKSLGGKDRTTVMHNVQKIESELEYNSDLKADINYIIKDLETL